VIVTATHLKNNLGRYLELAQQEDITITRNGTEVARLSSARANRVAAARSLFGLVPDRSLEQARQERLARYESAD
jgi:prevent-host-death family protein